MEIIMEIYKDFSFDSAHYLPNLPKEHKCSRLHGHTFWLRVVIAGLVNKHSGWVMDFSHIKEFFEPLRNQLDHHFLNEISGLENPTSEVIVQWIWYRLRPRLSCLIRLELKETCTSGCIYTGPELI